MMKNGLVPVEDGVQHKLSDQLGRSLATGNCSRTLWLAGGAQRTAGRGSLHVEMGTTGGRAGSQTTCSGILGERGSGSVVLVEEERDDRGREQQCGRRIERELWR